MYKFLSEQPEKNSLKFGHDELLKTLVSIVRDCSTPFTIGLYGKWGSGKSSIAEGLRVTLKPNGFPVILFDVWKHEGDALRRTFLKELVRQLQGEEYGENYFNKDFRLSPRIDGTHQEKKEVKITLDLKTLTPFLKQVGKLLFWVVFAIVVIKFGLSKLDSDLEDKFTEVVYTNFFSLTVVVSIITWIFSNLKDFISKSEVSISQDRLTDPHDFESEFAKILDGLSNKRIVIVFDNLDRVSGETALQIISTIKTFLEPIDRIHHKDVVFMVPCDVEAIKEHLSRVLRETEAASKSETYADEFLRKFFNTVVWIPEFYSIELESFALEKLKETNIPEFNNDHLSWLIVQVFKQNPRQIIQFINILVANYLLLERKSSSGSFGDLEFHKNNVPQLAKYLLLIQKFPNVMDDFKSSRTYDLNSDLIHASQTEFYTFRENTRDIHIQSLEPFFNFKISDQEKGFPGISRLFQLIEDSKFDEAIEISRKLEVIDRITEFSSTLTNFLTAKNNSLNLYTCLNGVFQITKQLSFSLHPNAYREIQKKIDVHEKSGFEKIFPSDLNSEFITKGGLVITPKVRVSIVDKWIDILRLKHQNAMPTLSREFEVDLLRNILDRESEVKENSRQLVEQELSGIYANDLEIWHLFINHPSQKRFVGVTVVEKIIESLVLSNKIDSSNFELKINLLERVDKSINDKITGQFLLPRLSTVLNLENQNADVSLKEKVFKGVFKLVHLYSKGISRPTSNEWTNFSVTIENIFTSNYAGAHFFIPILVEVSKFGTEPYDGLSKKLFLNFFSNHPSIDPVGTSNVLASIPESDSSSLLNKPELSKYINRAALSSIALFKALYPYASSDLKLKLITQLINSGKMDWLKTDSEFLNSIGIPHQQPVFNNIVSRIDSVANPNDIGLAFETLNLLNIDPAGIDKNPLKNAIISAIKTNRSPHEIISAYHTSKYFNDDDKREVCKGILADLKASPRNNPGITLLKESISLLTEDMKREFDELIKQLGL